MTGDPGRSSGRPQPAPCTVLFLCLQQVATGATSMLCFSIDLALILVVSGALAALGVRHAAKRSNCSGTPCAVRLLIALVGVHMGVQGLR